MDPKIVLTLPPFVPELCNVIYPSLPLLAAVIRQDGFDVEQRDLNREFLNYIFEIPRLEALFKDAAKVVAEYHRETLLPAEQFPAYRENFLASLAIRFAINNQPRMRLGGSISLRLDNDRDLLPFLQPLFDLLRQTPALMEDYLNGASQDILSLKPGLVGISVPMGPQLEPARIFASQLKKASPGTQVVLGGPCISLLSSEELVRTLKETGADALIPFEGEDSLRALCAQKDFDKIPNLAFLKDDQLVLTEVGEPPKMSELPVPEYDKKQVEFLQGAPLSVLQSRGCYWNRCAYCDYINLYGDHKYRHTPPEQLAEQIDILSKKFSYQNFQLVTESLPAGYARRFAKALKSRELEISWSTYMRVDHHLDKSLAKSLGESGLELVTVGVESFCDRVLKVMDKGYTGEQAIEFLKSFRGSSVRVWANMIPDLPSSTREEALYSLEIIKGFLDDLEGISVFPFSLTRSSDVGANPEKYGLTVIEEERASYKQFSQNDLAFLDQGMSSLQKQEVLTRYQNVSLSVSAQLQKEVIEQKITELDNQLLLFKGDDLMVSEARFSLNPMAETSIDGFTRTDNLILYAAPAGRLLEMKESMIPVFMLMSSNPTFQLQEFQEFGEFATGLEPSAAKVVVTRFIEKLFRYGLIELLGH